MMGLIAVQSQDVNKQKNCPDDEHVKFVCHLSFLSFYFGGPLAPAPDFALMHPRWA